MDLKNGNLLRMNNSNHVYSGGESFRFRDSKNGLSNDNLELRQKKSIENYRQFLSNL